jgi:hypothetical protein
LKIVLDGRNVCHAVGSYTGDILIHLVVYRTLQRGSSIFYDDPNRLVDTERVLLKRGVTLNRAVKTQTPIIVACCRKNLNPVVHPLHTLNRPHHVLSVGL